jgi:ketosteroid isomerase-like protein
MWLLRSAVLVMALLAGPALAAPADPAFEAAVEQSHKALAAILQGDPSGYTALFADRDDVTLGNPFGPYAKGKAAVVRTLAGAAAKYRDGLVVRVDRIAQYGDGTIIGLVEVEHDRAKVGSRADLSDFSARVTSIYERIDGQWKLVHRHADPITSPRPAESVLQK